MNIPPWYRPRRRYFAETLLTLDLSRAAGIGPLKAGLSTMWDMTPILCASDSSHRMRVTVDADARMLSITRRGKLITTLSLRCNTKRFGQPLRAVCPECGRLVWRLYFVNGWLRCGKCLHVTYATGRRGEQDRALARKWRLEHRLDRTDNLPRHRGRRRIEAEIERQDARLFGTMPVRLRRALIK